MQGVLDFDNSSNSGDEDYMSQTGTAMGWDAQGPSHQIHVPPQSYDPNSMGPFTTPPYSAPMNQQEFSYNDLSTMPINAPHSAFPDPNSFNVSSSSSSLPQPPGAWTGDQYSPGDLSDILGELKINENGVGEQLPRLFSLPLDSRRSQLIAF